MWLHRQKHGIITISFQKKSTYQQMLSLLLCRHGEGDHLVGRKFSQTTGPSLTKTGKGQAYRRVVRQLNQLGQTPDVIYSSPQLRALETATYARKNKKHLTNGSTLKDVPFEILKDSFEQTRCLADQGNIIPPLDSVSPWPNTEDMKRDKNLWEEIESKLSNDPDQPRKDPYGSALPRALRVLNKIKKNAADFYNQHKKGMCVLLICHDGIARDIQRVALGKRVDDVYDLCEIRQVLLPLNTQGKTTQGSRSSSSRKKRGKQKKVSRRK